MTRPRHRLMDTMAPPDITGWTDVQRRQVATELGMLAVATRERAARAIATAAASAAGGSVELDLVTRELFAAAAQLDDRAQQWRP